MLVLHVIIKTLKSQKKIPYLCNEVILKMKICDVVMNSVWYDPRVRKQIEEYINNDIDLSCVGYECNRYDKDKIKQMPCDVTVVMRDSRYIGKQRYIWKKLIRERIKNRAVRDAIIAEKPDVIHANDFDALIPAMMAQRKLKCKVIYDSHEIWTENNCFIYKRLYSFFLGLMERRFCKKVDLFLCVSNAAAEYFKDKYHIEKPMVVTNCCLKSEQKDSGKKNPGFEVLNHGQFYDGRGYDIMVETIPLLKDYPEIKLAVRVFGKLEDKLRKRAEELGGENFIFYPKVLVQELIPEASKSMVGVAITEPICLNFELSVSNKLFEYASAGLPVIMSDIPEHRYLNDKYQFGVIISENTPEALANAVVKLYTDKAFYEHCAENAKKLSDEVNWENEFGKLIEFEKKFIRY